MRYGQGLEGFSVDDDGNGGVVVRATTTGGGVELTADLLVGAEGMHSGVRGRLLQQHQQGPSGGSGGGGEPASRGYVVYRGVAEAGGRKEALAPGFSFQVCTYTCVCAWLVGQCAGLLACHVCACPPPTHIPFHIHDNHQHKNQQTWGLGQRFASVPLADGQVWFATLPLPLDIDDGGDGERRRALLLDLFGGWHAPIPALLQATPPGGILRDAAVAHRAFPPFVVDGGGGGRGAWPVTLVGDAAHGVDPILAQGAGVAVEDAYHLACACALAAAAGPWRGGGGVVKALRWVVKGEGDGCWL